jgi:CO/xanthine dehydrogenase Mo-binding subunit
VEVTGIWNYIHTGTSIFKTGCLKEIGSGAECIIGETLFYGDIYDGNTAAVMQMSHGMFQHPTSLDINPQSYHLLDVQNDDVAAPCGGRGIAEPCVSNVSAVTCAIFNATGKWINYEHGAATPDKVLKALGKA